MSVYDDPGYVETYKKLKLKSDIRYLYIKFIHINYLSCIENKTNMLFSTNLQSFKTPNNKSMLTPWRKQQINEIIERIKLFYIDSSTGGFKGSEKLDDFSDDDREYFNTQFSLPQLIGGPVEAILSTVLEDPAKYNFSIFMLRNGLFPFSVSCNQNGVTAFQLISKLVFSGFKSCYDHGLLCLFKRCYKVQESDAAFVSKLYGAIASEEQLKAWCMIRFALLLDDPDHLEIALQQNMSLFTIVSFKMKKPVGIRYPNLLGVANNAFLNYRSHGDLLIKAMQHYGAYDQVIKRDRKQTFRYRLEDFEMYKPVQDSALNGIVFKIFPELKS